MKAENLKDNRNVCNLAHHLYRESIRDEAKAMVENTKALTVAATGDQEKLAETVQSAANTMTRLAKVMKLAAASLGGDDPEGQVGVGYVLLLFSLRRG